MIERNRNPAGALYNLLFGLCEIADGIIRVTSLGYLHSRFALEMSKRAVKSHIARQKKQRDYRKNNLATYRKGAGS